MTQSRGPNEVGDAYIGLHADGSELPGDIDKALKRAGKDAEDDADDVGKDLGEHIGDGIEKEVGRSGPRIGKALGDAVSREDIDIKPNLRYNVRGKDGRFISRTASSIQNEVEQAFNRSVSEGGFLKKFQTAIGDAIGAAFNVPGRSPLIAALVPLIGAVIGLVFGLLQIINAVAATLTTIPALIGAIGLQVGILMLAFNGVGDAVKGAFAATNAKELQEALKGLAPAAQTFVKSLLPLKPLFKDLQQITQQGFFLGLGDAVTDVTSKVLPILRRDFGDLSFVMGQALGSIVRVFSGPEFTRFLNVIIPSTQAWLAAFGPAFAKLLTGLINLGTAATPLLNALGSVLNSGLTKLGENLTKIAASKDFQQWLTRMFNTLELLWPLLQAAFEFIVVFLDQLDKAGGRALLTSLTDLLRMLTGFIASEAGLRSINILIGIAIASFYVLTGAAITILFLLASIQAFVQWLVDTAIPAVVDAIVWFGLLLESWVIKIGEFFNMVGRAIGDAVGLAARKVAEFFINLALAIVNAKRDLQQKVAEIPQAILAALANLGTLLYNSGRSLITGLINGIKNAIPGLRGLLNSVTNLLPDWKGPEDKDKKILQPAGRAVMEGFGTGILDGAKGIESLLGDFTAGLGGIGVNNTSNHILFGANALQVNFRGALPTQNEAMSTGVAVGAGISSQLAARNTRLAVRTL